LGFGGEWAAGAVLIAETVQARYRGKAVAAVQSGWSVGYGAAALLFTLIFNLFPAKQAWRLLFFAGVLPALLVFLIRRFVQDSEIYVATRRKISSGAQAPHFWEIFTPPLGATTTLCTLLTLGILGGNYNILTWLPTYLRSVRHLSVTNTGAYLLVNISGSFFGYVIGGYISDRLGRRRCFVLFACCATATVVTYMFVAVSNPMILVLGFPLGFFQSALNAGVGAFLSELFPSRIRGAAQGFSYNAGRGIGALFPFVVGRFSERFALGDVIGAIAALAYSLVVIAALMLPETRGKELAVYA